MCTESPWLKLQTKSALRDQPLPLYFSSSNSFKMALINAGLLMCPPIQLQ